MKIFKTKKMIFAVVTALVLLSTLPFLQSCSNDLDDATIIPEINSKFQKISFSDIPKGITPLKVKNTAELEKLMNDMENMKFNNVNISKITEKSKGRYEILYVKLSKNSRLKSKSEYGDDTKQPNKMYDVVVECTCPGVNSPNVMLTSRATNFSGLYFDWNQKSASGSWGREGDKWYLEYNITATVDVYAYANGVLFLTRQEKHIQGIIYFD